MHTYVKKELLMKYIRTAKICCLNTQHCFIMLELLGYAAAASVCPHADTAIPYIYMPDPMGAPVACNHVAPPSDE